MGWRRKRTVRGFGRTNAAAAAAVVLSAVTIGEWQDGDPAPVVAAWAAATALAVALVPWAFHVEAERAFGPPGSPERRRRRLTPAQLARSFGAGALVAGAYALVILLVTRLDDSTPSADRLALLVVSFGLAFGAAFAWNAWAAADEDEAAPGAGRIPARSALRPVAAPPRDRTADRRRGFVVCALLAVLGVLAAIEGFADGDGERVGVGIGLALGSAGLLLWGASQQD